MYINYFPKVLFFYLTKIYLKNIFLVFLIFLLLIFYLILLKYIDVQVKRLILIIMMIDLFLF